MRRAAVTLSGLRRHEVGGGDRGHLDLEVDAAEHGTRDARLVALGASRALAADIARLGGAAAEAGISRHDELDARGVGDALVRRRDPRLAGLERLAQRVEDLRMELRQLVEKEDAGAAPTSAAMLAE